MTKLTPVDFDPFEEDASAPEASNIKLTPVDGNPFAAEDEAALVAAYNKRNPDETVTGLPDRSGAFGRVAELGMGMLNAVRDQFPQDMARIARGFTGGTPGDGSFLTGVIDENQRDMENRLPSKQVVAGDGLAESLAQGPASIATSAATGVAGAAIGGKAGAIAGAAAGPQGAAVGGVAGSMVGAGALSGAAFYNLAKDQFLEEMYDKAKAANPNLTQGDWQELSAALDADATEFGLWEAGPEAVSQFFTAGLIKGVGGKVLSRMFPGASGGIARIGENALARATAKVAAEVGEEEVTEGVTFMGQEGIRQRVGLREDAPTVREFVNTQAGPVAVGSVLQIGGMGAIEKAQAWRKNLGGNGDTFVDERIPNDKPINLLEPEVLPPEQAALPSGATLALPQDAGPIVQGTDKSGLPPIRTMADMPSGPTIAVNPTLALPETATYAPVGMWGGGRSQLAYEHGAGLRNDIPGVAPYEVMPVAGPNDQHKAMVGEALASGKEVPLDILASYGMATANDMADVAAAPVATVETMPVEPVAPVAPVTPPAELARQAVANGEAIPFEDLERFAYEGHQWAVDAMFAPVQNMITEKQYAAENAQAEADAKKGAEGALVGQVRGRLDGAKLREDYPNAYKELVRVYGPGFFRSGANGGVAIDEIADELKTGGILGADQGGDELLQKLIDAGNAKKEQAAAPSPAQSAAVEVDDPFANSPEPFAPKTSTSAGGFGLKPISDKAFVVTGDTKPIKDQLKAAGGKWNVKHKGWMFSNKRQAEVESMLAGVGYKKSDTQGNDFMTRDQYDQWRVEELNKLNPQLGGRLSLEILDPVDQASRPSNGDGFLLQGGHYGSTITRSQEAPVGTTTHEIRHMIDMLLGGNQVSAFVEDLKGQGRGEALKELLKRLRSEGKIDKASRFTDSAETAGAVLDAYYRERAELEKDFPDVVQFLDQMGADKYAYLTKNYDEYTATAQEVPNETHGQAQAEALLAQEPTATVQKAQPTSAPIKDGVVGGRFRVGEVVLTATGRKTSPFPKALKTLRRADRWLMQNAIDEADSRGDDFAKSQFQAALDRPQQADKDAAEHYLFDKDFIQKPAPRFLKPLINAVSPENVESLNRGDVVTSGDGRQFAVWDVRHGVLTAHPIVDGKPSISADTIVKFNIDDRAKARNEEYRSDTLYFSDQKAQPVQEAVDSRGGSTYTDKELSVFKTAITVASGDDVMSLRPSDVYRAFGEVKNMGESTERFKDWILSQGVSDRVAKEVTSVAEVNAEAQPVQNVAPVMRQRESMNTQADEDKRLVALGQKEVPGIRLGDALDVGRVAEARDRGDVSREEWDSYVADLVASGSVTRQGDADSETVKGTKVIAQRMDNAVRGFVDNVREQFGFTEDEAKAVLKKFVDVKAVKLDPVMGVYKLNDGRFWDKEVMLRAIAEDGKRSTQNKEQVDDGQGNQAGVVQSGQGVDDAGTAREADGGALDGQQRGGGEAAGGTPEAAGSTGGSGSVGKETSIAVKGRDDLTVRYEVVEAGDIAPSHNANAGFEKNQAYTLENERTYHSSVADRRKVLEQAQDLKPKLLMAAPDANQGAPVVDHQGNVLGGNGRAMSIEYAYEKFPDRAKAYKAAIAEIAEELGLDADTVSGMDRPVLIRRVVETMPAKDRQALVSDLNASFTHNLDKKSESVTRASRLSDSTLRAMANVMQDADSLRKAFDSPQSRGLVEMLVNDGVIQDTERNAYIGEDGLLNPDGKGAVERAIRGRFFEDYEGIKKVSGDVIAKIDAAAPYLLIAENVGGDWNITDHVKAATTMAAEYKASGFDTTLAYLTTMQDMGMKPAPIDANSKQSINLFLNLVDGKVSKKAFESGARAFASYAGISEDAGGMPGIAPNATDSFKKAFQHPEGRSKQQPKKASKVSLADKLREAETARDAVQHIAGTTSNASYQAIASKILETLSQDVRLVVAEPNEKVPGGVPTSLNAAAGVYRKDKDRHAIYLRGEGFTENGMNEETVLHEALHAVVLDKVRDGNLVKNKGTELFEAVQSLYKLQHAVVGALDERIKSGKASEYEQQLVTQMSVSDVNELVSWGMTNNQFQEMLKSIPYDSGNAFTKFVSSIMRMLGLNQSERNALVELISVTDKILDARNEDATVAKKVENYGEKLVGSRKDRAKSMLRELSDDDIAKQPLSKIWPAEEIDEIDDKFMAAFAMAARAEIPAKPRKGYKVNAWVAQVQTMSRFVRDMLNGKFTVDAVRKNMETNTALRGFSDKVALFESIDRKDWGRIGSVNVYADAYRFEDGGKKVASPFATVEIDGKPQRFNGATSVADIVERVSATLEGEKAASAAARDMQFEVRGSDGDVFINKAGDPEYRKLKTFGTSKEAFAYIKDNHEDLVAAWKKIKERDNVTKADIRKKENRDRAGEDYRKGKDVTAEHFAKTFGFRGVEFGEWVSQGKGEKDRQGMLNQAYDALMDLANIVGVSPSAISLNGSLGLGFGSRGSGWASAHFEPGTLVINLTKTRGSGSLAHEWFHALDNYFQRERIAAGERSRRNDGGHSGDFITYAPENYYTHNKTGVRIQQAAFDRMIEGEYVRGYGTISKQSRDRNQWTLREGVRPEVAEAFSDLVKTLDASPMAKRSSIIDKGKSGYWSRTIERAARAFENYVMAKMSERGFINDYLANVVSIDEFRRNADRYPYLMPDEVAPVAKSFDELFSTLQERKTDNGTALFFRPQFKRGEQTSGLKAADVQKAIDPVLGSLFSGADVQVIQSIKDLPEGSYQKMVDAKATNAMGVHSGGVNYLIADNISDVDAVMFVLKHELFHDGIRRMRQRFVDKYGHNEASRKLNRLIDMAFAANKERVLSLKDAYKEDFPDLSDPNQRRKLTEEWLANQAALQSPRWYDRYIAALREFFRAVGKKLGMRLEFSASELRAFIGRVQKEDWHYGEDSAAYARPAEVSAAGATSAAEVEEAQRMWAEMGTESPYFKKWFGDSKVVDEHGKPLVVYHGTAANVEAFDPSRAGEFGENFGPAVFFTQDPGVAGGYAARWSRSDEFMAARKAEDEALNRVRQAVLDHGPQSQEVDEAQAEAERLGAERQAITDRIDNMEIPTEGANIVPAYLSMQDPLIVDAQGQNFRKVTSEAIQRARGEGRDGVIIRNVVDSASTATSRPSDVYVAFEPTQIKSATGNRGTFDPEDARISFMRPEGMPSAQEVAKVIDGFETGDLGDLAPLFRLPHWLAKKVPSLRQAVDRQFEREERRSASLSQSLEAMPELFGKDRLKGKERQQLIEFLWEWDGMKVKALEHTPKFVPIESKSAEKMKEAQAILASAKAGVMGEGFSENDLQNDTAMARGLERQLTRAEAVAWPKVAMIGGYRLATNREVLEASKHPAAKALLAYKQAQSAAAKIQPALRANLKKNEKWDKVYRSWITSHKLPTRVADAAYSVRMALDDAFVRGYNRLASMAETPDTMLQEMRSLFMHLDNYLPHSRIGAYGVAVYSKDGEALYREHYDAPNKSMAKIKANKMLAKLRKEYPEAGRFWAGVNRGMPEEIYEQFLSMDAMEKMLFAAVDSAVDDKATAAKLKEGITVAASDEFKARGWLSHAIGRKNVPGFERENIERVLFDYFAGHHGFLEKVDAAKDMAGVLKNIDPKSRPNEHAYVVQYVKDMLRNGDKVDRVVGNIKALAFVWYLGGVFKTATVNLTQNIVSGAPTLGLWTKGSSHVRIFDAAMRSLMKDRLSEDERRLIKELHEEGLTQANLIREVQGRVSGSFGSVGNRVIQAIGWPMATAEKFNRVSLALAAYRAARSGALNEKSIKQFNIKGKADYDQAKTFAEAIVRDAHFVYGKSNLPQPFRSSKAGRMASAVYTFRSFNHNMLELWANALTQHGLIDGGRAVLSSMAGTMVLGGLRAAPFFGTAMAIANWIAPLFGGTGDDDWMEKLAKRLPKEEWLRDMILFGVPSLAGIDLGGSLKMEAPMTDKSSKFRHGDILGNILGEFLGVPYAMVQSVGRAKDAAEAGATARAIEEISPVAIKSAMAAYRLSTEGAHSITGSPIKDPLTGKAKKLSSAEAAMRALGFQAVSQTKASLTQAAVDRTDAVRSDKANLLANRIANAVRDNNQDAIKSNLRAWQDWNKKVQADDKPSLLILPKDIKDRLKARLNERKVPPRDAIRVMQMMDAYGTKK